jgi:TRAP-type mannitol/chloroaromatic compound transport system permease small subunit
MGLLEIYIRVVDATNTAIGKVVAWLTFGTVVTCFATVYFRYALDSGFIWMQEAYVWQHAIVFLVGAGYTLLHGGHVRVDIFYARMTARNQARVEIFGTLVFMMPFLWVMFDKAWPFFVTSFVGREGSQQPDGIQNVWLLKSTLVWFCVLVGAQGLATVARAVLFLNGRSEYAPSKTSH